ncbi:Multiple C2 and transmembrane domain-containing protein [Eumeta japonica]|uniref:Multiple C2 and transmembrane domain-containing protein n=1 Tax=Eumeta variegata TaxID=151549 RepID=A0A4C1YH76_EUMVA|nr:Multiple C2 and transmembrane domain-containing protein [Eumeta japonica]
MDTDQDKKSTLHRVYFAKLHEKVHNKYEEMQKKLDKYKHTKGIDERQQTTSRKDSVTNSIEDLTGRERNGLEAQNLVVQEVGRNEAISQEIEQFVKYESESDLLSLEDNGSGSHNNANEDYFSYPDNSLNASLETLNDEFYKDDTLAESPLTPTKSSPKRRLRHKIGSRITAAMEKRQRDKERQEHNKRIHGLSSSMETYNMSIRPLSPNEITRLLLDVENEDRLDLLCCFNDEELSFYLGSSGVGGEKLIDLEDIVIEFEEEIIDSVKSSQPSPSALILSNTTKGDLHKMGRRMRTATLTIALIEVKGLASIVTEDKSNALYCRFRLGAEKCKSKFAKISDNEIKWLEMFNVPVRDEYILEVTLWDKENQDSFLGRAIIDVLDLEKEKTHEMRIKLDGSTQNVEIFMLLTISGTTLNTIMDMDDYKNTEQQMKLMRRNFAWYHLADDYRDVGCLSVLVYGAKGLAGGDPFCVLELGNTRLQTDTEYKTADPNWMKIFVFTVTDITSILVVSVFDENKQKAEILGKISIPLLQIRNGEKKWYALKDKTQRKWANGDYPRILLEMRVTWNPIKASIRVINPKEQVYMKAEDKLNRHIFARNIYRSRVIISWLTNAIRVIKKNEETNGPNGTSEDTPEKEDKWSIRETLQNFQEMTLVVQNAIGTFASLGESIKNLVNFTVPYLSWLAIVILVTIAIVMYLIPVKYIFMAWAINKFTRKILRPNRIPNNEILDLLSRVPDDEVLMDCQELPLDEIEDPRVSNS